MFVYTPPEVRVIFADSSPDSIASVQEFSLHAGVAIGTAVVTWPRAHAGDQGAVMGGGVTLMLGNRIVFRGVISNLLDEISEGEDSITAVLVCDKWRMAEDIVGQPGTGTQPTEPEADIGNAGFKDVGFDVVFNAEALPNKDPGSLEFSTGSTAVFWTLKDCLMFLFEYYVEDDAAEIEAAVAAALPASYNLQPSHLELTGMSALDAVDVVVSLTGSSWGLLPGADASAFVTVIPGAGIAREIDLFRPAGRSRADAATNNHARSVSLPRSVRSSRDVYHAISSRIIKETTYSTEARGGVDPLLTGRYLISDAKFLARFAVDVEKYEVNQLGANLSAGSKSKPWLKQLVSRITEDGSAYLTAAEIVADPVLAAAQAVRPVVWLSPDSDINNAVVCTGGYRIDYDNATIDFEATVDLAVNGSDESEEHKYTSADWPSVGVWLTIATVLEVPETDISDSSSEYLPSHRHEVIRKNDLIPERREIVLLPDLAGEKNEMVTVAAGAEEKYVDISDRLTEAITSAIAATPQVESPLTLDMPFLPELNIGNKIVINGRNLHVSGNEVVTSLKYRFDEGTVDVVIVQATNIPAAIDPEQFVEGE